MSVAEDFVTLSELRAAAKEKLPREVWAYAAGAAGTEHTRKRNHNALHRLALEQHILTDVREVDISTTLFGTKLPSPIRTSARLGRGTSFLPWPCARLTHETKTTALMAQRQGKTIAAS